MCIRDRGPVDLNGEYRFKVDGKGRVSLPSKFRKVLSKDLVVARELEDQCLYVFETPDYNAWVEKLFVDKFGEYKESDRMHVAPVSYTHLDVYKRQARGCMPA